MVAAAFAIAGAAVFSQSPFETPLDSVAIEEPSTRTPQISHGGRRWVSRKTRPVGIPALGRPPGRPAVSNLTSAVDRLPRPAAVTFGP